MKVYEATKAEKFTKNQPLYVQCLRKALKDGIFRIWRKNNESC
jgi:hypothetical protein